MAVVISCVLWEMLARAGTRGLLFHAALSPYPFVVCLPSDDTQSSAGGQKISVNFASQEEMKKISYVSRKLYIIKNPNNICRALGWGVLVWRSLS